ncbi:MAG: ABC transporter transmembrane domain-containing protein, partial [Chloroflexota bacterium]
MSTDVELIEIEEEEHVSALTAPIFNRIVSLLKPHWQWVIGFIITIALTSIMDSFFTYINKNIIDLSITQKNVQILWKLAGLYGLLQVIQSAMVFTFIYLAGVLGERIQYDLRKSMFDHLQELSLSYYSINAVGRLIARVTSDSGRVADLMTWGLVDTTWAIMNISTATVFMFIINWKLALIVLAVLPILAIIAFNFRKNILIEFRKSRRANSKITGAHNENIQGVRVVKALGREPENLQEFQSLTDNMYQATFKAAWLSALFLPTVQIITAIALGFIVWYGGIQALSGALTIGGIHAFVSYLTFIMWPIQDLARVYAEMQHSIASAERIFKLIDTDPDVRNKPGAVPAKTLIGEIEFSHVNFYYEDRNPVISDFSLSIQPGETIALVGPTGGGKSTIVNLLCRFYEPSSGTIKINGIDYTDFTMESI